jgi:ATP-dependent RNA/DNA helicase IGHMBP2
MDYFKELAELLRMEKESDRLQFQQQTENLPAAARRANGTTWYPVAIRGTELGRGDYLTVEIERTSHTDLSHQLRFGASAALFSNHDPREHRVEGLVTHISGNRLRLALRTDELPDWSRLGKLGVDLVFDELSYGEMEKALRAAGSPELKKEEAHFVRILAGGGEASFTERLPRTFPQLNAWQEEAVNKVLAANELAIIHGPPGTGKTTTLVAAIEALWKESGNRLLVVAPSNTAVDLLSERLSERGLHVVRIGNPVRVSDRLQGLTLDSRMEAHADTREIRRLKKQAAEYKNMAHKYKRQFGKDEREQRRALFAEAHGILQQVERMEQYITDDILSKAAVITATLVGAAHYTVRQLRYETVVIDEAGQALEPASWIPILKGRKLVLAGDHCQLPPTVKSDEAARKGLSRTLLEKLVARHPSAVVLLQEQYRMHEQIMKFPAAEFYEGRLHAYGAVAHRQLPNGKAPLSFIDTAGCGFEEVREDTAISNPEEARFLVKLLQQEVEALAEAGEEGAEQSIAVVSPYKQQVELLKELTIENGLTNTGALSVNTIDAFQGQERDVVYISLVRSNPDQSIGFLGDVRRMNVAMTRARKRLVVIGDSATLSALPFYDRFIRFAEGEGAYTSAWEFL